MFGGPSTLVASIETHKFAAETHIGWDSGCASVTVTPTAPYARRWVGEGNVKQCCFGTLTVINAAVVNGAAPITAGGDQPYVVAGVSARSVTITCRLEDVPTREMIHDLQEHPSILVPTPMSPDTVGTERTVAAVLPLGVDEYRVRP